MTRGLGVYGIDVLRIAVTFVTGYKILAVLLSKICWVGDEARELYGSGTVKTETPQTSSRLNQPITIQGSIKYRGMPNLESVSLSQVCPFDGSYGGFTPKLTPKLWAPRP
ncbi:hypothetical protein I7I51_06635 [Histoplasma capsulatum]|uniref:Uncharacterized protein n=1 Tax=Ajellomyces capsulatus TaxID=5037 RepID=A0A8A1MH38_AJECA|nr:hypothetical protein I7I51_06635 [Histoplasma capsulatum]